MNFNLSDIDIGDIVNALREKAAADQKRAYELAGMRGGERVAVMFEQQADRLHRLADDLECR
jgi:hypothetical protein